jgi:glycosyltransferase involved in cell wall biosynthesis
MSHEAFPLSIIVHTKNSSHTLKACLESAKFANEIIVVDMQSTDNSKEIAKKYTSKIYDFEDVGYVEPARNFALEKATHSWVFLLDADEEVSDALKQWLQSFLTGQSQHKDVAGYFVPRKNFMFGKEVKHTGWWPDYQFRFFKKAKVSWSSEIHSTPQIDGKTEYLPADPKVCISHQNYKDVTQFIERMNHYSTIMAKEAKGSTISSQLLLETFTNEFCRRLFEWDGVKDGGLGAALSVLQSTSELSVKLKQWEKNDFKEKDASEESTVQAVESMDRILRYWIADWYVKQETGLAKIIWMIRRKLSS